MAEKIPNRQRYRNHIFPVLTAKKRSRRRRFLTVRPVKVELPRCPKCYSVVEKNATKCLQCGASLKTK